MSGDAAWAVREDELGEAFCITVVVPDRPWELAEVVRRLGGHLDHPLEGVSGPEATESSWYDGEGDPSYLISSQNGRWLILELNGFQGSMEEVQRVLSAGASTYTQFEGMNGSQFVHSRDGVVLVAFDPVHPEGRWGAAPEALGLDLAPSLAAVRNPDASLCGVTADLLVRRAGVILDRAWWEGTHLVLTAPEIGQDPPPPPDPLQAAFLSAPRDRRAAALLHAVRTAAVATGIADDAPPRQVLQALEAAFAAGTGRGTAPDLNAQLNAFLPYGMAQDRAFSPPGTGDLVLREGRGRPGAPPMELDPIWHRMQAASALHTILSWSLHDTGWPTPEDVLRHVRNALPHGWAALEPELLQQLTPASSSG